MYKKLFVILSISAIFVFTAVLIASAQDINTNNTSAISSSTSSSVINEDDNNQCPDVEADENLVNSCEEKNGKIFYKKDENGCEVKPVCVFKKERPSQLTITPTGNFLARGMIIKEIDSDSNVFVGEVWGTTWKIDVSKVKYFVLKNGVNPFVNNILSQLKVGEEVGVSGVVKKDNPGIVYAKVVRNYNLLKLRRFRFAKKIHEYGKKIENKVENKFVPAFRKTKQSVNDIRSKIQSILEQIKAIQEKINAQ